jgi:hypothetical protein
MLFLLLTLYDFFDGLDDILLVTHILYHILSPTLNYSDDLVQLGSLTLILSLHVPIDGNTRL